MISNSGNRLYRYLQKDYAIQAIESGLFKIGRLSELNDPFEFIPVIDGAPAEKGARLERFFIEAFNDSVGLLCFSNVIADPVVWSHYAAGHGGIAIGLEYPALQELVEKGDFTRVTYSNDRPKINHQEFSQGLTPKNLEVAKTILGTKAESWKCEQEYRLFIPLAASNVLTRNGMYWHPIPKHLVVDVVPGIRCSIEDEYLRKALKDGGFLNANVRRAKRSKSQFEVELTAA